MAKSKLDSIVEAFDVPDDTKGEQIDDEKVEDEAQKLNEEDIKPEVKEKESDNDGDSQSDLSNVE
jgi:hypothetical protein